MNHNQLESPQEYSRRNNFGFPWYEPAYVDEKEINQCKDCGVEIPWDNDLCDNCWEVLHGQN